MDDKREHVGVGGHAGVAPAFRTRQVFARGRQPRVGRAAAGVAREHAAERLRGPQRDRRGGLVGRRSRDVATQRGSRRGGALTSAVEHQLLDADGGVKEPNRIRMIERVDGEIVRGKLSRRQQGAEDEDRLIARAATTR